MQVRTAVVILNWNTEGFLRDFLPPLLDSVRDIDGVEVIVADNASEDGSMKLLAESFPDVKTIRFESNLGFTGGYNKAFRLLCDEYSPEYLVLINSDIEVTGNWLRPILAWMDTHPDCGACAPKLHSWHRRECFEYAGAAGGYIDRYGYPFCRGRVMKHLDIDHGQFDTPKDVFWATGACLTVRSEAFWEAGGLDERFFAHMEEIDLCWKMQLNGWRVTVVPQSVVYHVGGGTLPEDSPFKLYLNYRNNLMMLENNLARTFALKAASEGRPAEKAVERGISSAARRIRFRKFLDILSALVYLLTMKKESFRSVVRAHKDAASMRQKPGRCDIAGYISRYSGKASVKGIYGRWIVLQALLKGTNVSDSIKEEDFIKI